MPSRVGSRRPFCDRDGSGRRIRDAEVLERIEGLAIHPAWKDVWISPRQYLYHSDYRADQEQEKYDRLIRFGEHLPELRAAMSEHLAGSRFARKEAFASAPSW